MPSHYQTHLLRVIQEETEAGAKELTPYQARLQALVMQGVEEEDPTLAANIGEGIGSFIRNIGSLLPGADGPPSIEEFRAGVSLVGERDDPAALRAKGSIVRTGLVESAVLRPLEALFQIPGLFTDKMLPTDRSAEFYGRAADLLYTSIERSAKDAGLTDDEIADIHLFGEMVGFVAPITSAMKMARFVTGTRIGGLTGAAGKAALGTGDITRSGLFARNFAVDTAAGVIFGGALLPEETIKGRIKAIGRESALFGVGALVINGPVFAWAGMRAGRAQVLSADDALTNTLAKLARGEQVNIGPEGVSLVQLLNEEGYLASSNEAKVLLERFETEAALVAGIKATQEIGQSMGIVRAAARDFPTASAATERMKAAFPNLKFTTVKRGKEQFDIFFGLRGLNNHQKAQMAREGRFAGMTIEKNGTSYTYVRRSKDGGLVVRTVDGKTTVLNEKGVTDLARITEEIELPPAGHALYEDYREFIFGRMNKAADVHVALNEEQIIAGVRDGSLVLDPSSRRMFDIGGAITHPEEIGVIPLSTFDRGVNYLPPTPIRSIEDAFDLWVRERGLPATATDIEAMRVNFGQRVRQDLWALTPEEDLAVFRSVRQDLISLLESQGVPLSATAAAKGFHVETIAATGQVVLRDINTGVRLTFGSRALAEDALAVAIRAEKDPFNLFAGPGDHGMPAFTGGYGVADPDYVNFAANIQSKDFLLDLPSTSTTNRMDYFNKIEGMSGVPLFTEGFGPIDRGMLEAAEMLEPINRRIEKIWKKLKREEKIQVAEFWVEAEGVERTAIELARMARAAGLSSRQIHAFNEARQMWDMGAAQLGLPRSRFIPTYYSRIRPLMEEGGQISQRDIRAALADDPIALKEYEFWAEMPRTGELAQVEMDPEIVMYKWFRGLAYKTHVDPHYQRMSQMADMKIKDLAPAQRRAVMARALSGTTMDSPLLPAPVQAVMKEYLNNIRGGLQPGIVSGRLWMTKVFKGLGMEVDERVFDEFFSTYLATTYGAALGLRIAPINRNAIQNLWMLYPRMGGRWATESLRRVLRSQETFDKWRRAGAVRDVNAGIPQHDAIFNSMIESGMAAEGTKGPLGMALASAVNWGVRGGHLYRKTAQKFLIPYGSSDQINRAWAAEWQYLHTAEKLAKFDEGVISWDKFLDDGLPFYSGTTKQEFLAIYNRLGREEALLFIGKQASDEANFIYGMAATPGWMQRPFGKMLGIFGQWPMWAYELYGRRMQHSTNRQWGAFTARTLSLMGMFTNIGVQSGVNMWNWMGPAAMAYGGGPIVDALIDVRDIVIAPVDRKGGAFKRLRQDLLGLALPGQVFVNELARSISQPTPTQAAISLTLGKPADQGNFAFDYIFAPGVLDIDPNTLRETPREVAPPPVIPRQ